MITGAHVIIYSKKPDTDRAFLRDILGLSHVDIGGGWLIFGLPPAELAVHPSSRNNVHELYLICEDIDAFMVAMQQKGITCSAVQTLSWGKRTQIKLPGGGKLGVYQPQHERPKVKSRGSHGPARRVARKPG
jgi:catechol 2,3-dioxygenase-like lactoylglutathione lyase family enzyme